MTKPSSPRISAVRPLWAVEGARVVIEGTGFGVDPVLPRALLGGGPARLAPAAPSPSRRPGTPPPARPPAARLAASPPAGRHGGHPPVRLEELPGEPAYVEIGAPLATGLHQV